MKDVLVVDSVTQLGPTARNGVVVCGSHGGMYPAWVAAHAGVRAIVLNDAGIGRHRAGIAGVSWLSNLGIAACAVDFRTARIGDGASMVESGVVTTVNDVAALHGCLPGHTCKQVAKCLRENAAESEDDEVPEIGEFRARIANSGHREVWAIDSVALARPEDKRAVLV